MSLRHMVEHVVGVYSSVNISPQHLEARPEGKEGVHEGASHAARRVHAHVHQQGTTGDILHHCIIVLCVVCECGVWGGRGRRGVGWVYEANSIITTANTFSRLLCVP